MMIYCGNAGFGPLWRSFSLHSSTIRLKRAPNRPQTGIPSSQSPKSDRLLDKEYPSAASAKPNKGVFKDKQPEFMQAYRNLLREVAIYLNDKGIDWGENTIFVNRIYFSKAGFINYFLFNTPNKSLNNDKIKKYLTEFSKDYRFPVTSDTSFRQCGTAPFRISQ